MDKILIKRGTKEKLEKSSPLSQGELFLAKDEERLYVGGPRGNISLPTQQDLDEKHQEVATQLAQIEKKVQWKTPQDYGAVGDGITDDSQAFLDMLYNDPDKAIRIPHGKYLINTSEKLPFQSMFGDGRPMIIFNHKDGGFIAYQDGQHDKYRGFGRMENIFISGNHVCEYLFTLGHVSEGFFKDVQFGYATKAVFKIDYQIDIVNFHSCVCSTTPAFLETAESAEPYNAINAVQFYGGNWWRVDNFIKTTTGGTVDFIGGWFEQTDRILLKDKPSTSNRFTIKLDNVIVLDHRGSEPLITLNAKGGDRVTIRNSKLDFRQVDTRSIVEIIGESEASAKLIILSQNHITGERLQNVVTCSDEIPNKHVIRVYVDANDIDFSYDWYNDISSKISNGVLVRGRNSPDTNHYLGFQLSNTDNESKIQYDPTEKRLFLTDQFNVRKYPLQGITVRTSSEREDGYTPIVGYQVFDKTLGKPIWYKGNGVWVDALGNEV